MLSVFVSVSFQHKKHLEKYKNTISTLLTTAFLPEAKLHFPTPRTVTRVARRTTAALGTIHYLRSLGGVHHLNGRVSDPCGIKAGILIIVLSSRPRVVRDTSKKEKLWKLNKVFFSPASSTLRQESLDRVNIYRWSSWLKIKVNWVPTIVVKLNGWTWKLERKCSNKSLGYTQEIMFVFCMTQISVLRTHFNAWQGIS